MRPAFSSRTKKRGIAALGRAPWEDFNNSLDISHLFCDLDRVSSKLDRDHAAQADDHL
jgi:hypothetical protein